MEMSLELLGPLETYESILLQRQVEWEVGANNCLLDIDCWSSLRLSLNPAASRLLCEKEFRKQGRPFWNLCLNKRDSLYPVTSPVLV